MMELLDVRMGSSTIDGWTFMTSVASKALEPLFAAKDVVLSTIDFSYFDELSELEDLEGTDDIGTIDDLEIIEDIASHEEVRSQIGLHGLSEDGEDIRFVSIVDTDTIDSDAADSDGEIFKMPYGIKLQSINATTMVAKLDLSIDGRPNLETVEAFLKRLKVDESEEISGNQISIPNEATESEPIPVSKEFVRKVVQVVEFGCQAKQTYEDGCTQTDPSSFCSKPPVVTKTKSALRLLEEMLIKHTSVEDENSSDDDCSDFEDSDFEDYDFSDEDTQSHIFSPCSSSRFSGIDF